MLPLRTLPKISQGFLRAEAIFRVGSQLDYEYPTRREAAQRAKDQGLRASKRTGGARASTRGFSWTRFFGWRGRARRGAICRTLSGPGTRSIRGSGGGRATAYGRVLSRPWADDPDFEYPIIDSTIVRAHQHAAGARRESKSGDRTLTRRPEQQGPHRRRRPRQSPSPDPYPGPGP